MAKLTSEQLQRITQRLKKCGVESPDFLDELTDHYDAQMEECIGEGSKFAGAFALFQQNTSWLKLRKLEWKFREMNEKSNTTFSLQALKLLTIGYLCPITWIVTASCFWICFNTPELTLHVANGVFLVCGLLLFGIVGAIMFEKPSKWPSFRFTLKLVLPGIYFTFYFARMIDRLVAGMLSANGLNAEFFLCILTMFLTGLLTSTALIHFNRTRAAQNPGTSTADS